MGQAGIIPSIPSTSRSGTFTTPSTSQSVTNTSTPSTSQSTTSSVIPSTSQSTNSSVTASTSPLANYLVRPVPVTPKLGKTSQSVSGARVLTSADSLRFLEEKALKKKQEEEEKEKRKQEREQKQKKNKREKLNSKLNVKRRDNVRRSWSNLKRNM